MTDHETTNPPGPGNPPSSTSPADAGGAVLEAVPPAGRVKLTTAQKYWLQEIAVPSVESDPFPPFATLKVLMRHKLVEAFEDKDDIFAKMTNSWSLRITDAGLRLLKEGGR